MPPSSVRWDCQPYCGTVAASLEREVGVSATVAAILARRGYTSPAAARRFLDADERHDPFAFAGMAATCELLLEHVRRGSRIVVHGDYDVDGVSSTAILLGALRRLGADPAWHLPSRFDGGYGLSVATVEDLARAGAGLLIAVDCGITSAPEVDAANALGLDVVVVDHHRPAERLPDCPIVHPTVSAYPFGELCAAGVALKLAEALAVTAGEDPARAEEEDLDLVALATVADLVPLRGENRRLVRQGLRALARTAKPGLQALMAVAHAEPASLDEQAIGFRLAPRINAAGRLGRADGALELLLTPDADRAAEIAAELDLVNRERRGAETRILAAAEAARGEAPDAPALVLAGEGWHPGVIGIVASRMVERHGLPCVLIAFDGGEGRGSGRSIPAYDLHAGLTASASHLRRFGGHAAAAGLEIDAAELESFRTAFLGHARGVLSPEDLVPLEHIDAVVSAPSMGLPLAEELERLAPFGQGNPRPTLLVPAARLDDVRALGSEGEHSALTLASGGARARVVAFGSAPGSLCSCTEQPHDVAARLELNEWNGAVEPRLALRALRACERGECLVTGGGASVWELLEHDLTVARLPAQPPAEEAPRTVIDRRGAGFAAAVGDLVSRGEDVLVLCADAERRRAPLEGIVGGLAAALGGGRSRAPSVALASWEQFERDPGLARPFAQLVALDPPDSERGERLLAGAPAPSTEGGDAYAHACWGEAEVGFALAAAHARLDLRGPLAAVYRALRDAAAPVCAQELESALRGEGAAGRSPELCARLMRVLIELELVTYTSREAGGPLCRVEPATRTELERSATYRAALARLGDARRYLDGAALRAHLDARPEGTRSEEITASEEPPHERLFAVEAAA